MEEQTSLQKTQSKIDSLELLIRYLTDCKENIMKDESKSRLIFACADIISAVYYYRRYPVVEDFINKFLKLKNDYFQIQWIRNTWSKFNTMTDEELCELVINQINLVDYSKDEE